MLLLLILKKIFASQEIEPFLDKEIKIIFSAYNHIHLSELNDGTIGGFNRFLSPEDFQYDDSAKISKNGENYEIMVGSSYLCANGVKIIRCKKSTPDVWSIEKQTFGYNIKINNKCITQKTYDKLELQKCNEENDKIFVFKLSSQANNCEEMKEKISKKEENALPTINVIPVDAEPSSDTSSEGHSDHKEVVAEHKPIRIFTKHYSTTSEENEGFSFSPDDNLDYKVTKIGHGAKIDDGYKKTNSFLGLD